LDVKDYQGKTPLQKAQENNHSAIADLLQQHGATA
jgi:hypothetical protein